ncbi:MAG: nucleoside monophosphate kinase [Candidatus Absconditabacteria bacterium]
MRRDIILFGIQGSGKGTQADLLMQALKNYQYFEPGNILRALKSNDNVLGNHIKTSMLQGKMVDDGVIFGLFDIYEHLLKPGQNMLIDGFMRSQPQMYYFLTEEYTHKRGFVGIHYDLSKEKAIKRIMERAKKEGREDDTKEAIERRLSIYEKETTPVIEYLDKMDKIIRIDADQSVEKIFEDTLAALKKLHIIE